MNQEGALKLRNKICSIIKDMGSDMDNVDVDGNGSLFYPRKNSEEIVFNRFFAGRTLDGKLSHHWKFHEFCLDDSLNDRLTNLHAAIVRYKKTKKDDEELMVLAGKIDSLLLSQDNEKSKPDEKKELKHLKGPWVVDQSPDYDDYNVGITSKEHRCFASIVTKMDSSYPQTEEKLKATLNLVLAAPKMIEALIDVLPFFKGLIEEFSHVDRISKASYFLQNIEDAIKDATDPDTVEEK